MQIYSFRNISIRNLFRTDFPLSLNRGALTNSNYKVVTIDGYVGSSPRTVRNWNCHRSMDHIQRGHPGFTPRRPVQLPPGNAVSSGVSFFSLRTFWVSLQSAFSTVF